MGLDLKEIRIKVKIPVKFESGDGECIWVKPLSPNTGEISNLPILAKGYKYKDIIEFDSVTWEVVSKIRDGGYSKTRLIKYKGSFSEEKARWEAKGYIVEGFAPGIVGLSRKRSKGDYCAEVRNTIQRWARKNGGMS